MSMTMLACRAEGAIFVSEHTTFVLETSCTTLAPSSKMYSDWSKFKSHDCGSARSYAVVCMCVAVTKQSPHTCCIIIHHLQYSKVPVRHHTFSFNGHIQETARARNNVDIRRQLTTERHGLCSFDLEKILSLTEHWVVQLSRILIFHKSSEPTPLLTMRLKFIPFLLGLAAIPVSAQDLLLSPVEKWGNQVFGLSGNAQFSYGNGVFLTPDESQIIAVGTEGVVYSYYTDSGDLYWNIESPTPEDASVSIQCLSGMAFTTENAASSYMVYSIGYKAAADVDSYTLVVALGMDGTKLYESPKLSGLNSGSPVISNDGKYVFLTHNSGDRNTGYFTILKENLDVFNQNIHQGGPFAPPGIYHSPAEGFYDTVTIEGGAVVADGTGNTNDMIMWSLTILEAGESVAEGELFGFQFQDGYEDNPTSANYFVLTRQNGSSSRGFRTITPPLITNQGRSAFWTGSRSDYNCFIGKADMARAHFNRGPNVDDFDVFGFASNSDWPGQPIWTVPATFNDGNGTTVAFGATASPQFVRITTFFPSVESFDVEFNATVKDTTALIFASPVLDPQQRAVYYVEANGTVHQADFETMEDLWDTELKIEDGVQSEIALNGDGTVLYVVSTKGYVRAFDVAQGAPTVSPSMAPAEPQPSSAPVSIAPTTADSEPTDEPPAPTGGEPTEPPSSSNTKSMLAAFVAFTVPFLL
eukprot:scaffold25699_cov137-Cylindrotheca_fusiformis.AAC.8